MEHGFPNLLQAAPSIYSTWLCKFTPVHPARLFKIQVLPCHKHNQSVAVWRNKNQVQISNMWLAGYHFRSTELTPLKTTHVLPRYSHLKCWPSPFPRRPTPRLPAKVCDVARRLSFCQWFGRSCLLQNVVHVLLAMFNLKTNGSESL